MQVFNNSIFRSILAVIGTALILVGCGAASAGQTFAIPVSEAKQILKRTEVPYDVLGSSALRSYVIEKSPTTLVWKVTLDGAEYMQFTAELGSNGATSTQVVVSLQGPASGRYVKMEKALNDNITVKNLYLAAMEEEVAAALEKRDFDILKISPQLMAATGANLGAIADRFDHPTQPSEKKARAAKEQAAAEREMDAWNAAEPANDASEY
jgi:hypothetical protein